MKTFVTLAMLCSVVACSKNEKPPALAPASGTADRSSESGEEEFSDKDPAQGQLVISDRIREACGLSETEAYFDYNSDRLSPAAKDVLGKLATCFTEGPLRDETMLLVGHADPRGSDEYNMVLGSRRAANVQRALTPLGMPESRISATSRGEMDAVGGDETGWARDRKVEVRLEEE